MLKKTLYFFIILLMLSSCADTWGSVKRGITGNKANSTDEFLVKKKDPLILPPDFESLPTPDEREDAVAETFSIQKTPNTSSTENTTSTSSAEESILQQIQKQ